MLAASPAWADSESARVRWLWGEAARPSMIGDSALESAGKTPLRGEKGLIPVGGYDVVDLCNSLLSDAFLPQTCV